MTIHDDDRLRDAPMVPVTCRRCGGEVLARKSSWEQTSVQWDATVAERCPQRREAALLTEHGHGVFLACSELRESIFDAARHGGLPILDEGSELLR